MRYAGSVATKRGSVIHIQGVTAAQIYGTGIGQVKQYALVPWRVAWRMSNRYLALYQFEVSFNKPKIESRRLEVGALIHPAMKLLNGRLFLRTAGATDPRGVLVFLFLDDDLGSLACELRQMPGVVRHQV